MSSPSRVSVLGIPAYSNHGEILATLQHVFKDLGITEVIVQDGSAVVTFDGAYGAKKFREHLPVRLQIGCYNAEISLNVCSDAECHQLGSNEAEIQQRGLRVECDRVNTWASLNEMPQAGKKGIIILDVPRSISPLMIAGYFQNFCRSSVSGISHILSLHDGMFVVFNDESVVEYVLKESHTIDGHELTLLPKVTPEYWTNKFFIKASTDIKAKFLKEDLSAAFGDIELEQLGNRVFVASLAKQPAASHRSVVRGVSQITPLMKTDCLVIDAVRSLVDFELKEFLESIGNPLVTKQCLVNGDSLIFFSNFEDAESILEKFANTSVRVGVLKVSVRRYFPELHELPEVPNLRTCANRTMKWQSDKQTEISQLNLAPPMATMSGEPVIEKPVKVTSEQFHNDEQAKTRQLYPLPMEVKPDMPLMSEIDPSNLSDNKVEIIGADPNCSKAKLESFLESKFQVPIVRITRQEMKTFACFVNSADTEKFRSLFHEKIEYFFGQRKYVLQLAPAFIDSEKIVPDRVPSDPKIQKRSLTICNFDAVHTWYSQPPKLEECNKKGILAIPEKEHPDVVVKYFEDFASKNGGEIQSAIPMVDGILITSENLEVVEEALNTFTVVTSSESLCIFPKRIPEYSSDKLWMKKTPKRMREEIQKVTLENCSSKQIKPESIKYLGQEASLIQYDGEMNLEKLLDIIHGSQKSLNTRKLQLSLLPKPDCLEVEMVEGDNLEEVQPILENANICGGGKVTRFDKISSDTALVYFTDYKDVEAISSKFDNTRLKFGDAEFTVKPYYHCFSNKHNRSCQPNPIDEYYRRYLEKASQKEFCFTIPDERVWKFFLMKPKNVEDLQSRMARIANITLSDVEPSLIFSPLLFRDDSGNDRTTNFESSCHKNAEELVSKFTSIDHQVDMQKLKEVRKITDHRYIMEDYDAMDQEDVSVRWSDNVVEVVGLKSSVKSFVIAIRQLVDITSNSMELAPEKYRWLLETKVFDHITAKYEKMVNTSLSDFKFQIKFQGTNEHITTMKCEILSHLEKVVEEKLEWNDSRNSFLLKHKSASDRVSSIFRGKNIKGILHIKSKAVSVLVSGSQVQQAVDILDEYLETGHIALETDAHFDVTTLDDWRKLVREIQSTGQSIVEIKDNAVMVAGFREKVQETVPILKKCICENLKCCEILKVEFIKACHVVQFCQKELQGPNLKWYLNHTKQGIALIGTMKSIEEAKKALFPVLEKMKIQNHRIDKPAIVEYFLSNQMEIELIAKSQNRCTILVEKFNWPSKTEWLNTAGISSSETLTVSFQFLKVLFVQSVNLWDDCDAVTCIHDKNDHAPGHQLSDGIWVESVADEKNKKFLHIFSSGDQNKIHDNIIKLLTGAEKLKCTSISIPVLAGGRVTEVAATQEMLKGFKNFVETNRRVKFIKQVHVLISSVSKHKDVVTHLTEAGEMKLDEHQHPASWFQATQASVFSDDDSCSSDEEEEVVHLSQSHVQNKDQSATSAMNRFGSLKVSVRHGDITNDSNDIIVNSIGPSFKLSSGGAVSKAIEKKGGSDIQKELSATSKDNVMKVTNGGKLKCKKIIHVDALRDIANLENCFVNILQKANELSQSSISFPAIGTGGLGISGDVAAQKLAGALMTFSSQHHQTKNLKVVDIVIFDNAMVPIYQSHLSVGIPPTSIPPSTGDANNIALNVSVKQGSITDEKTEMIVNSLGNDFSLSKAGAVSKEISQKGGPDIQKSLTQAVGSQIRVTTAGNLACKYILHVATSKDITKLKDLMIGILTEAENQKIKSLSIPAIGTGGIGFPSSQAADHLFAGLREFCSRKTAQHLKDVNFVVFEKKMVQDFEMQLQKMKSNPNPAPQNSPPQTLNSQQFGLLQVAVRQGDITRETNDMILNSLGPEFSMLKGGPLSRTILARGGQRIQDELSVISGSEIRVTMAGNLLCKKILHLSTPKDDKKLKKAILNVLSVADDEKCNSISIPALGTGGIGLSSDEVAKVLFEQINEFSSQFSPKCLKIVDIVVFQSSMLADFQNQLDQMKASAQPNVPDVKPKRHSIMGAKKRAKPRKTDEKEEKSLLLDSVRMNVCKGKISGRNCDVIVHNTNRNFDLRHGKFPPHIYGSCKNKMKQEIDHSTDTFLRETSCGIPIAKKIFHVILPNDSEELKKSILQILNEVLHRGYDSVSLMPPKGRKSARMLFDAAVAFNKANANKRHHLTINFFGNESKVFKHLYDAVIGKGRSLPGAKIQILGGETQDFIHLQLCSHDGSTKEAIGQIESKVKSRYHEERIPCSSMEIVEQRRMEEILDIGDTNRVKITQTKGMNGECFIVIEGIKENVLNASMAIKEILSELSKAENIMKLGSYFWQYLKMDGKNWEKFQPLDNLTLEESYQGVEKEEDNDEGQTMFVDGERREFEIDTSAMKMIGYRTVDIRREVIEEFPKTWSDMGSETIKQVKLQQSDPDYQMVAEKFLQTKKPKQRTIISIIRLQNKLLYQVFETKKAACKKHCRTKPLSRYLFHGTKPESVQSICEVGFDRIHSGTRVGAKYGLGNYFAVDADYSANSYAAPDSNGMCSMFLAEVITGDFVKGKAGLPRCPKKPWSPHVPYESLVDDLDNPTMFVAFHDAGTYPSFVINFKP